MSDHPQYELFQKLISQSSTILSSENKRIANENVRIANEKNRLNTVNAIQTDYNALKKVIIDENQAANLQDQINKNTSQLDDVMNKTDKIISIDDFKRLENETDDTGRLQRAVNSFSGNVGGAVLIPYTLYISGQITINKTGVMLKGIGNKISRIVSSYEGTSIYVKPLFNGNPYTNTGYCKFYIEDLSIQATGKAIDSGVGLYLHWIYSSLFKNLFTSGFRRHVVLKGSHLNQFVNLYQENSDSSEQGIEIHNRGVCLSADIDEMEGTSNNNSIIGGWIHNSSIDFTNLSYTHVQNIDIEPASNTCIIGSGSTFTNCRFERMDIYALQGVYNKFPWFFIKGDNNKFINCIYGGTGDNNSINNPIFKVYGNYNQFELYNGLSFFEGIIVFEGGTKSNTVTVNSSLYSNILATGNNSKKAEGTTILLNGESNKIIYNDIYSNNSVTNYKDYTKAEGIFKSYCGNNADLINNVDKWAFEGLEVSDVEGNFPLFSEDSKNFIKLKLYNLDSNTRMYKSPLSCLTATHDGVYTLTVTLKNISTADIRVGCYLAPCTLVTTKNEWITVQSKMYFKKGDEIIPTIQFINTSLNDEIIVGNINVCAGECSTYFENYNNSISKKVF